jgi:hypothetical protein
MNEHSYAVEDCVRTFICPFDDFILSQCHVQEEVPAHAADPCMYTTNCTNGWTQKKPAIEDPDKDVIGGINELSCAISFRSQ